MIVKICGITNLEDARAAVEGGASALGFNFYPTSPRYVPPDAARRMIETLPEGVWKVGVFVKDRPEWVAGVARDLALDIAQVHGGGQSPRNVRVWRAVAATPSLKLESVAAQDAEAILLDAPSETQWGGTGQTFDWKLAAAAGSMKIVIAGGLDETNVRQAIEEARPWGVDACSRLESAPGRKDHARMARFLKAALS